MPWLKVQGSVVAACALAVHLGAQAADEATSASTAARGRLARWLDPATAPFIPIPEIDTEPHSGLTLGVIPTWLRTSEHGAIDRIIAPDIIHSQYFGWGSRVRIFGYPSSDTQWSVVGGGKQRVEREFDAHYLTGQARHSAFSWDLEAIYDRSGTPRFFGLGNRTPYTQQTSYIDNQGRIDITVGRNITPAVQLAFNQRWRDVEVLPEMLRGLPAIGSMFPTLRGLGTEHALQQSAMLICDTRDSPIIPRSGARYIVYDGFVSRAFGSSVSYTYFGAEARHYSTLGNSATLAWHASLRYMPSAGGAPFWALSSLGGDRSVTAEREPLRGHGADRYIDRNMAAGGVELRTPLAKFDAFGTRVSLEFAPFVDTGKVFADMGANPFSHLHTTPGFGVRGVASPFVVGYLDFGFGYGKPAVFSGINYPF